ncbi:c-type cytochrome [Luteolibacter flavescens]|uniref:C-type cytochrome n=1 Tax=Luteolibacter flavescens TaxID=1859460 RepID=A0ABT3FIT3_9BACT|nr:HEAT repeat domain-containing protein [Luteolibacter flavescens]MCW1883482.1 c-type cytochrome [Luteolibacter flavescens]
MKARFLWASTLLFATGSSMAATKVLQAFEGDGYGDWKTEGTAFGLAPVPGKMDGLTAELSGYSQDSLACSAHGGDVAKGTLTSPEIRIAENYICFLVAGGKHPGKTAVQLLIDGKVVREATGENTLQCKTAVWDVTEFKGKTARIRLIDDESGQWGIIAADQFVMTDYANYKFPPTTKNGKAHAVGLIATNVIPGMTIPEGSKAAIVADYKNGGVTSPTALAFGEKGEIYVTETTRFRHGVPDNRDHLYWYLDDISARTTEDRRKLHEKWKDKEEKTSIKFLTEKSDRIRVLSTPGADGKSATGNLFADGFNDLLDGPAAGVFELDGTVYMACIPDIWALRDKDGDGKIDKPDERQKLFEGFGVRISFSGHDLNGFALGPDGRIYGTLGDRGMNLTTREGKHYEYPDQGCVFRFDPDGSNFEVIHTGLRNPKEIAFDEYGNGISVDNNSDQGDQARIVYIVDGADSGWTMEHQALHSFHRQIGMEDRPPNRWMEELMWAPPNDKQPAYILPPVANLTSGPSGLTYHPGAGFLEEEVGRFLICDYRGGAANSGIWSFKLEPSGANMKLADSRQFNWGAAVTDVEYSWDGKVVVTDFITGWQSHENGRVYSLAAEKPFLADDAEHAAELIEAGFDKRPVPALEKMLTHPDMRIRLRAQIELTRKDGGFDVLANAAKSGKDRLTRLHGIWGLGIVARRGSAALVVGAGDGFGKVPDQGQRDKARAELVPLLSDKDAEIRAQVIKVLGESGLNGANLPLMALIADESPRVRSFATIAAGRLGQTGTLSQIYELLAQTEDPVLRHAGAFALSKLCNARQLAALNQHESVRVRVAAVVALRRLKDPAVAAFLRDGDPKVSHEALQAIHDVGIEDARPSVADLLDAPPAWLTVMDWRRVLHSALRLGDEKNLQRVVAVVLDEKAPEAARAEALRLVGLWSKPHPVDQSLGHMAPLPERDAALVSKVLTPDLAKLLQLQGKLAEPALALVSKYKLDLSSVDDATIRGLVMNQRLPGTARSEALELYASRKPAGFDQLLGELAKGQNDDLAIGAIKRLIASDPAAALESLKAATSHRSAHRQQEAWKAAGDLSAPGTESLFVAALEKLKEKSGATPSTLELLDAAVKRTEPAVKTALDGYKAAIAASTDPLAPYLGSLQGGDAKKGEQLFESQPAGQCMRCHAAGGGHGGGDAGPNLEAVGKRGDAKFLLESMVNPGAKVAIGFGISSVTLKGGKSVAGLLLADEKVHVDIDSNGKVLRVLRSDIESMTPPVSAMPPMGGLLSASELRDIVAWLGTKKGKEPEPKKRPAPELVKP